MGADGVFVHPQGINDAEEVGEGTRIWAFAHVMKGARLGKGCNVGESCFVEGGAVVGNHVTIKNGVAIWDLVTIEDHVFVGPYAVFTNDKIPRSHPDFRTGPKGWEPTLVRMGATIGANATIVCGVTLGSWSFVAAGAVVTRDVPDFAMVAGNPAHQIGWACKCGRRLPDLLACACGLRYTRRGDALAEA
jgi:acetyltransferase-like isoleucine patch superfamily enzyme